MLFTTTLDYTLCLDDLGLTLCYQGKPILEGLIPMLATEEKIYSSADYTLRSHSRQHTCLDTYNRTQRKLVLEYAAAGLPDLTVTADMECKRVVLSAQCDDGAIIYWSGLTRWGDTPKTDTFAVDPRQQASFIRAAVGPASNRNNIALLDRQTGKLLDFGTEHSVLFSFDYAADSYRITSCGNVLSIGVQEDFYQKQYGVHYKPITKDSYVTGPHAGFGTYYPWLFQGDEKDLSEELDCLKSQLGDFGSNSIVLDAEWVRNDIWGSKDFAGDHFTPDLQRFPSGMKAVAKKIKDAGFVPHLWFGVTCEPHLNEDMLAHPEIVLADDETSWCGRYFLDLTHPYVLEHYLPRFYQQVLDWGFEAGKWDLLCETYDILEAHHNKLYNPTLSSAEIIRNMLTKAREFFGDRFYLCQCGAPGQDELRMGADLMDCCRIGRDLWSWDNFHHQMLDKLCSHYPLHNVMLYCDPDHALVAEKRIAVFDSNTREEKFISTDEAVSRLTPVVLLGLCLGIGDDLRTLTPERLDMLRRSLPVADVHPQTIGYTQKQEIVPILVQVDRPFGVWSVFALVNTTDTPVSRSFCLQQDLGLDKGDYLLFDYWQNLLVGQCDGIFEVQLRPRQSVTYAIHRRSGVPQLLSSSRHLLQGAVELEDCRWDHSSNTLTLSMQCIRNYPYRISLFVPDGYRCTDAQLTKMQTCEGMGGSVWAFTTDADETAMKTRCFSFTKE